MTRALALLAALVPLACSRPSSVGAEADASRVDPVEAAGCGTRPSCRLESQHDEPRFGDGSRRVVALVTLGKADRNPGPPRRAHWPLLDRGPEDVPCILRELWLLRSGASGLDREQLLTSDCTRDVQSRPPTVADDGSARVRYTPEPSEGLDSLDFALDPPALTLETHVSGGSTVTWSWPAFRGEACAGGRCVPALPEVPLGEDFAREGWKTTALGGCSMLVDGKPGATSQGVASGAPSAAFRMLLSEGKLYVEVTDDVFVTQGAVVDTLDIVSWFDGGKPGQGPRHQRLRMDGRLTDDMGADRKTDVVNGPGTRRFALPGGAAMGPHDWKVVYEDSDDGRTLAGELSSGPHDIPPPRLRAPDACAVDGPSLRVLPARAKDAGTPLVPP